MKLPKKNVNTFKMELASDVYADTRDGYNGNVTNKHSGIEAGIATRRILHDMEMEAKIKKE